MLEGLEGDAGVEKVPGRELKSQAASVWADGWERLHAEGWIIDTFSRHKKFNQISDQISMH